MSAYKLEPNKEVDEKEIETREWLESLEYVIQHGGPERVRELLHELQN
nr:hypothetical protein [Fodinibius sp.]NIX00977.1 hypothetical protein [Phycisphaerae bacterium]NIY30207.1 hypothetical protein [Fodinibius sp.]